MPMKLEVRLFEGTHVQIVDLAAAPGRLGPIISDTAQKMIPDVGLVLDLGDTDEIDGDWWLMDAATGKLVRKGEIEITLSMSESAITDAERQAHAESTIVDEMLRENEDA